MATVQKKTALITGCSTGGIGWAMVKAFRDQDYYVFATMRDPKKAGDLIGLSDVEILELDVTVHETVVQCKETVAKRTGGSLDVLVNNAGVEFILPLLEVDIAEAKQLFDVNVWGPLIMVQTFAPLLIKAKGLVCNHTSLAAVLPMVWTGIYASAKAAETRMSEIMRLELEPLGVRVVTVMLGSVDTPIFGKPGGTMNLSQTSYYHGIQDHNNKQRETHQSQSWEVGRFARDLVQRLVRRKQNTIWLGAFSTLVRFGTWAFPSWYVDRLSNSDRGLELVKRL